MEKWKQFEETVSRQYFVSTKGRVMNIKKATGKKRMMKPSQKADGYFYVHISELKRTNSVHILVAEAFIPNSDNKLTVNHINGVGTGDHVENLEWATHSEQDDHARKTGLKTPGKTPAIVLNSNGEIVAQYDTMTKALNSYDGKPIFYNRDTKIIGNVIVMKQSYYDTLSEDEIFSICYDCFQRMVEFMYVVNGQFIDDGRKAAKLIDYSSGTLPNMTSDRWSANINGHRVSRVATMLKGSIDKSME